MNKLEKIRELKEEISNAMKEPWGCGRSPFEILTDILSLMEDDVKDVDAKGVVEEHCCGNGGQKITAEVFPCCCEFETCDKLCTVRANHFKDLARTELNKLAFSILRESVKINSRYREVLVSFVEGAVYDTNPFLSLVQREKTANIIVDRLFGEIGVNYEQT